MLRARCGKLYHPAPLNVKILPVAIIILNLSFSLESTVDAEPGDYLAIMAKEDGSEEYIELYDQNFERMRLRATGYEPRTFEMRTEVGEGVTIQASRNAGIILPPISIMANLSSVPITVII